MKAKKSIRLSHPPPLTPRPPSADLVLEIGTEELPAAYLDSMVQQLGAEAGRLLDEQHIAHGAITAYGTPRRLVLLVASVNAMQRVPSEEIRGPSKQAAFDASGAPTQALQGFLRSRDVTVKDVKVVSTEKGEYVYVAKPERQVPSAQVLPGLLQTLISRIRSPKTMRWDGSSVRFARPIRWLLALSGDRVVPVQHGVLRADRFTWVGGPKRPTRVRIADAKAFVPAIRKAGIVLNQADRRAQVLALVNKLAQREKGRTAPELMRYGLVDEVANLLERPVGFVGSFSEEYLALPREVLLASMAKHQRVFAVEDSKGKLRPRFIALLDGAPKALARVSQFHEHILNARLADSLLFWKTDHAQLPIVKLVDRLDGVTFHEKLGSMAKKVRRLEALAAPLARAWSLPQADRDGLARAALLSKCDLVTTMVKEFPTLQGIMGRYYAADSSESDVVARAIEEHYLPQAGRLPETLLGAGVAIIEKFDTLASYFGMGIEPTGDQDPFGLRRCAQGIVEVAWTFRKPVPLRALLEVRASQPPFAGLPEADRARLANRIVQYVLERLYSFDWPKPTPAADVIAAVLSAPGDDPLEAMDRVVALRQALGHEELLKAAKVIERTRNILKGAKLKQDHVDPERFQEPLERTLWQRYEESKDAFASLAERRAYSEATQLYSRSFYDALHEFFDHVVVNVNDEAVQQNRLALMQAINSLYTGRIADLSKLALVQPRPARATS